MVSSVIHVLFFVIALLFIIYNLMSQYPPSIITVLHCQLYSTYKTISFVFSPYIIFNVAVIHLKIIILTC
uniref:Uncharacterized protein n=1 Tax=Arundo donax TaxID=35708 RepID=A0A0A9CEJ5_ARUDO